MTHPATTRVFTRILDCGQECARLFFFGRALNTSGSSRVCVTVDQLMAFFGIGRSTVYRWLAAGEGIFWHRNTRIRSCIELWLVGLRQVCKNLNLGLHKNVLGAIADVPLAAIATRFGSKAMATHLDALQCQSQAWWRARNSVSEGLRKFVLKPWERVASTESLGANETSRKRFAFESEGWTIPGTSIAGIRKQTNWKCDRTIQRRLSTSYRKTHGLAPLPKMRVAEEVTDPNLMASLAQSCSTYVVEGNRVYKVLKFANHEFFALKHNIYGADGIKLLGLRRLRGTTNQHCKNSRTDIYTGQK